MDKFNFNDMSPSKIIDSMQVRQIMKSELSLELTDLSNRKTYTEDKLKSEKLFAEKQVYFPLEGFVVRVNGQDIDPTKVKNKEQRAILVDTLMNTDKVQDLKFKLRDLKTEIEKKNHQIDELRREIRILKMEMQRRLYEAKINPSF